MSELERSALEAKDRDELVAIATALGGKPASRAKKADIVSLILDLTGVTSSGGDDAAEAAASDTEADPAAPPTPPPPPPTTPRARRPTPATRRGARPQAAVASGPRWRRPGAGRRARHRRPGRAGRRRRRDDSADDADAGRRRRRRQPTPTPTGRRERAERERPERPGRGHPGRRAQRRRRRAGRGRRPPSPSPGPRPWRSARRRGRAPRRAVQRRARRGRGPPRPARRGLRLPAGQGLPAEPDDVYVSVKQARQFGLRKGDLITGASRPASRNEKNPALLRIDTVNGVDPEQARGPPPLRGPHPAVPRRELRLETRRRPGQHDGPDRRPHRPDRQGPARPHRVAAQGGQDHDHEADRPVDRDQQPRGPPHRAARRRAARRGHRHAPLRSRARSSPRPSTARPRSTPRSPSWPSSGPSAWSRTGKDVVIILDGITRLARAYNLAAPATGRIMSGGIDTGALYPPKKFFGAARNIEEGGSLTILATALVETGSKMDEVIFEEFKGTGNMELRLDRRLAERRDLPGHRRRRLAPPATRSCCSTASSSSRSGSCAGCSRAWPSDERRRCRRPRAAHRPPEAPSAPTTSSWPRSPRRRPADAPGSDRRSP